MLAKTPRAATIKDIAADLGLAISTVSRALTRPDMLRPETVQRVREAVDRLGYQPNFMARDLKLRSTGLVFVIVPNLHPFFLEVQRGIEKAAREVGYAVVMGHSDRDGRREGEFLDQVASRRADGIILVSSADAAALAARKYMPPTVVALEGVEGLTLPTVRVDHTAAAINATKHLIDLGHTRIAHIAGPQLSPMARHRHEGFLKTLSGLSPDPATAPIAQGQSTVESGEAAMRELLNSPTPPTAVFAANDEMAIGAIRAIKQAGLRVPEDVSVVGFNDQGLAEIYDPALTTIHVPTCDLGHHAMIKLQRVLAHAPVEMDDVLPTQLMVRATTAPPPAVSARGKRKPLDK
jgi:LacI family repressor for deo operon, udp, cdd, tsx, nupC, and nupG